MSDISEMTEKKKELFKKKAEVEIAKLRIKKDELEIRKLELEGELELISSRIKEVMNTIIQKQKEN